MLAGDSPVPARRLTKRQGGTSMTSPSPAGIQQQFQTPDWRQSNLDHCNQCGATGAAHGPDWTCPARPARANAAVWLALAIVLTAGGVIAQVFAHANQAMQNA